MKSLRRTPADAHNLTEPAAPITPARRGGGVGAVVKLYSPLLHEWTRCAGLQEQDAADLMQDVFATLVQKLPEFNYNPQTSFRSWLRTITLNKWRDRCRRKSPVLLPADPGGQLEVPVDDRAVFDEVEYREYLVGRALQLMQAEFPAKMWQACWEHVVCGRPPLKWPRVRYQRWHRIRREGAHPGPAAH